MQLGGREESVLLCAASANIVTGIFPIRKHCSGSACPADQMTRFRSNAVSDANIRIGCPDASNSNRDNGQFKHLLCFIHTTRTVIKRGYHPVTKYIILQ
jgi:predicted metal-dependent phosphotriesterase family hydrolase